MVNSTGVLVEYSIGRIKRYARLTDPYDGTIGEFNREFNVITGRVNLYLLWDKIDRGQPPSGRGRRGLTGTGPFPSPLLQAAPRSEDKNRCTLRCYKDAHEPVDAATKNILSHIKTNKYVYNYACDIACRSACRIRISNICSLRIGSIAILALSCGLRFLFILFLLTSYSKKYTNLIGFIIEESTPLLCNCIG